MGHLKKCPFLFPEHDKPGFRNSFRIDAIQCFSYCSLKKKKEDVDLFKWIQSGGLPSSILNPCIKGSEKECQ